MSFVVGFPDDRRYLSEQDFRILSKTDEVIKCKKHWVIWRGKISGNPPPSFVEQRLEWLANNATTKSELEYLHMFEGYVVASQSG